MDYDDLVAYCYDSPRAAAEDLETLRAEIERLRAENEFLQREITSLRLDVDDLTAYGMQFGDGHA